MEQMIIYQHERINPLSPMESIQDISDNGKKIVLTKYGTKDYLPKRNK